ncbi:HK97 gp10 family phage protein, partial [Listeria sp. FSL L7-1435]|nr:HK97 gp10 family phage protein [Listeria cossartiae subsp. cossartiae]
MANRNGFEDAMKKLGKLSNVNELIAIEALEEAANFFVNMLRP